MSDFERAAVVINAVSLIYSQSLLERTHKHLSSSQREASIEAGVPPMYKIGYLIILVGGYYAFIKYSNISERVVEYSFWGLLLSFIVASFILTRDRLKELELDQVSLDKLSVRALLLDFGVCIVLAAFVRRLI